MVEVKKTGVIIKRPLHVQENNEEVDFASKIYGCHDGGRQSCRAYCIHRFAGLKILNRRDRERS